MEKLDLTTPDFTQENIAKIAELFPNVVTEAKGADGKVKRAIDFDALRQELSNNIVEGPQERYHLNWPGKRQAMLAANAPINKTLRPCREESVNFDTTRNLFIEGDNLDALKLLQETYLGEVKMIYIDPPYNTGNDFIYRDDFAVEKFDYLEQSGQRNDQGGRLVANSESNGRYHSDWLSMIASRIKLAKNLLTDDGVLFVSIDDSEVSNLRKILDERFGEAQFQAQIIWKKRNTPPNDKLMAAQHDYILVYGKTAGKGLYLRPRSVDQIERYQNPDNHPKGPWVAGDLTANVKGGRYVASLNFPIKNPRTLQEFSPPNNGNWRFNREKIEALINSNEIYFGRDDKASPKLKRFLCDVKDGVSWTTLWDFAPLNTSGSLEMGEIFGNPSFFENPKPVGLLELLLDAGSRSGDIVLDFFAGSGSTAHAVLRKNAAENGHRRFISVQLPESVDRNTDSFVQGFVTIADICKERIRRAGAKILDENPDQKGKLDVGFRVLKIDSSNMANVYHPPEQVRQEDLLQQVSNIKPDRTAEDLLFQVLLDWGVDITLSISREAIEGNTVFFVDGNVLAACFDTGVNEALVKQMAARKPLRVVFRDDGFDSDATKINVEQWFKHLSPDTEVKVI